VLGAIRRNGVASDARLSQQILLDFACCWRSGQSLEEVDLAWYLEFGQPTDQIFANIIRVQNMLPTTSATVCRFVVERYGGPRTWTRHAHWPLQRYERCVSKNQFPNWRRNLGQKN
jgi:hypothetical protein